MCISHIGYIRHSRYFVSNIISHSFDYLAQISTQCFIIYNSYSLASCNLSPIKWIQSIRSQLTVSFMIANINVLLIKGIKRADTNSCA